MCLTCIQSSEQREKEEVKKRTGLEIQTIIHKPKDVLFWERKDGPPIPMQGYVHGLDNKGYQITDEFRNEMAEKALALVTTGVDFKLSIWAIQWPNDYVVKHFPTTALSNI